MVDLLLTSLDARLNASNATTWCHDEGLATTTLLCNVRISEDKSCTQLVFLPVHFAANDAEEGLAVYQNFDTVLFHDFIELLGFVHIFEMGGAAGTAAILDADPDHLWVGLVHELT